MDLRWPSGRQLKQGCFGRIVCEGRLTICDVPPPKPPVLAWKLLKPWFQL
jgi:hypothetical protein